MTATTTTHIVPMDTPAGISLVHVDADGSAFATTVCCSAAVTGTTHGVACKSCYHAAPEWMGVTYTSLLNAARAAWGIVEPR